MIDCPCCSNTMFWQSDFTCEDVFGCNCGDGIVSFQLCAMSETLYTYTTDCQNIPNGLEKCEE